MSRLQQLFLTKKQNILNIYFTAGFPQLHDTTTILKSLEKVGVDLVEIGMPFSDPLADGETIQKSSEQALKNGMTISLLFQHLEHIRQEVALPIILMGYLNPVLQYGIENFCKKCQEVGIDAVILPDMPLEVYQSEYAGIFEKYGIANIFLITPQTSTERIKKIDSLSNSFIYMVSSASTTGAKEGFGEEQITYFERIQAMNLKNPQLIGFGIANHLTFSKACEYANGAIIGSAFIKHIAQANDLEKACKSFVEDILATKELA